MTINISGEVEYEMLDNLIKAFNLLKKGEKLEIYFSSPEGGLCSVAEAIIDFVNINKERIKIAFYGYNFSSGMHIMLRTECNKKLLPNTNGMYHLAWQPMDISEGGNPTDAYGKFALKEMKDSKARTMTYLKTTKLSDIEVNKIKKGQEVYFTYDRLQEIIY